MDFSCGIPEPDSFEKKFGSMYYKVACTKDKLNLCLKAKNNHAWLNLGEELPVVSADSYSTTLILTGNFFDSHPIPDWVNSSEADATFLTVNNNYVYLAIVLVFSGLFLFLMSATSLVFVP